MKIQLQIASTPPGVSQVAPMAGGAAMDGQFESTLQSALMVPGGVPAQGAQTGSSATAGVAGISVVPGPENELLQVAAQPLPKMPVAAEPPASSAALGKAAHSVLHLTLGGVAEKQAASAGTPAAKPKATDSASSDAPQNMAPPQVQIIPEAIAVVPTQSAVPVPVPSASAKTSPSVEKPASAIVAAASPPLAAAATPMEAIAVSSKAQADPIHGAGDRVESPAHPDLAAGSLRAAAAGGVPATPPLQKVVTVDDPGTTLRTPLESITTAKSLSETRGSQSPDGKRATPLTAQVQSGFAIAGTAGTAAITPAAPHAQPFAQRSAENVSPQAINAAGVLARMDSASSVGGVQLRSDARHLEVGIQTAAHGWLEVRATTGTLGQVDASIQVQSGATAHSLNGQSSEIASYVREQSVQMGALSVGVGTGEAGQGSGSARDEQAGNSATGSADPGEAVDRTTVYRDDDPTLPLSMISLRA